ncbi:MAG: calcium/sodium antiporter [Lewinella sp.]|nr:calcium/sodium antiporter [Lewinella sp.]
MIIIKLVAGLILLLVGAELLVRGAARIASSMSISPLVVGLTVVAFGTSSPELAVSLMSSLNGTPDIALGNVVGSNIFNILFILGISALIIPLSVAQQLIRIDVPLMIAISLIVFLFALNGIISIWEGWILALMGIGYTIFAIKLGKKEPQKAVVEEYKKEFGEKPEKGKDGFWMPVLFIVSGLGMLIYGSRFLVDGAVQIAQNMGVSELVIGLTIIAAGTSLPELATSILASIRKERDIAVGNVIGSNIFNLLIILGTTVIASPGGIRVSDSVLRFDLPVMLVVALACFPVFFTGRKIARWEGFVFLGYFIAYTVFIILASQQHASIQVFSRTVLWFALPITFITFLVLALRERNGGRSRLS